MLKYIRSLLSTPFALRRSEAKLDDLLVLQARALMKQYDYTKNYPIQDVEFKVFSQWGDDGIIQYLIKRLNIQNKSFIEFGVENYRESNTRFLLMNNNWRGLIFDGSSKHINTIKGDDIYWRYNLKAENKFITKDNINELLNENGFSGQIGILHIDIDGNDYWVWNAINVVDADIVIMEYNTYFGAERAITVPYNPSFVASEAHHSRLYFGASLASLIHLGNKKGFYFIGCNSAGNNAYFLNNKYAAEIAKVDVADGFVQAESRQCRDEKGNLLFYDFKASQNVIKGMPVINTIENKMETF